MKICPNCHSRFDGNEAFCPNDGTALVEAKELSPGALTGTTIGKSVILERLMWSDDFGERYSGRMVESKAEVHVTVVNPGIPFADDAAKRIEATRARVGTPLPSEINTLLRTELNHLPSFVIQTAPRGPSLREVLDERTTLDWETAGRIVCRAARASQWLLDQGVVHWTLHPGSMHVSRLAEGAIQLGEWYFDSLMGNRTPMMRLEANEPFPGYLGMMAPEIAAGGEADARSVVFALGALFFELVTGKPPYAAGSPKATLERLETESAVKLSIASESDGLHPELDDVIAMMLAREPDKRLQVPAAAIAVLSNILGADPDEIAPAVERSDDGFDELYSTTELGAFDRAKVEGSESDSDDKPDVASKKTLLMAGPLSPIEESDEEPEPTESAPRDVSPSTGISGNSATSDSEVVDDAAPGAPVIDEPTDTEPTEIDTQKTLMMGSIAGDLEKAIEEEQAKETAAAAAAEEANESDVPDSQKETLILTDTPDFPERVPESEIETREVDRDESEAEPAVDEIDPEDTQKLDLASEETDREPAEDEPDVSEKETVEHPRESPEDEAKAQDKKSGDLQIGFVEAPQGNAPAADDWFSGTTEDAWERTLAEEHAAESERRWKLVLGSALAIVVFAGLCLIVYSQFIWEPTEENGEEVVAEEEATAEEPAEESTVDVERLVDRFDRALEAGRLSNPPGNSAFSSLEELLENAPDDERTAAALNRFVAAASEAASKFEEAGDLAAARTVLGHATTVQPDDSALRERYQALDEKYRASLGTLDGADAGSTEDAGAEAPAAEEPAPTPEPAKPTASAKPEPKPKPKPAAPKEDIRSVLKDARAAYSRDDAGTAETLYKKALSMDSRHHAANAGLGQVYFDKGSYATAVRYQMQAVRAKPNRVDYRINLGQSFYRLGKYKDAIRSWEAALARDPDNQNAKRYIKLAERKL